MIYLDTHIVLWLYDSPQKLRSGVRRFINAHDLLVSPMVVLELEYLHELRRSAESASTIVGYLDRKLGLKVCDLPFPDVVGAAARQSWTRDPFDRIIVGQAVLRGAPLVTKDHVIRTHYPDAFWSDD